MKTFIDCTQDTEAKKDLARAKAFYNDLYERGQYVAAEHLEPLIQHFQSEVSFLQEEYFQIGMVDFENISTGRHP